MNRGLFLIGCVYDIYGTDRCAVVVCRGAGGHAQTPDDYGTVSKKTPGSAVITGGNMVDKPKPVPLSEENAH